MPQGAGDLAIAGAEVLLLPLGGGGQLSLDGEVVLEFETWVVGVCGALGLEGLRWGHGSGKCDVYI